MSFSSFAFKPALNQGITDAGFTAPSPIQAQTIPAILQGRDVMACAQTGTGKTAAFVLPALNTIVSGPSKKQGHGPRVLVLTPTRELAQQVTDNIRTFSKHISVRSGVIIGGVSYTPQMRLLAQQLDILVATPGRLIDHMNDRRVDFSRVEILVLDEADRMLDMGFLKPVEKIIAALASRPQILLFSATFNPEIEKVATRTLTNPHRAQLAVAKQNHTSITQHVFHVDNTEHKQTMLAHILKGEEVGQAIIFSATKRGADRLAEKLEKLGFSAGALHGDMKQNQRKRTLDGLHTGKLKVVVATDVAARGLDVKNLSHVINYDLPNLAEDYTHRIGRTGRAGAAGIAISLVSPPDLPLLRDIEKRLGKPFAFQAMEGLESSFTEADFRQIVSAEAPPGRPKMGGRGRPQAGGNRPQGNARSGGARAGSGGYGQSRSPHGNAHGGNHTFGANSRPRRSNFGR
jgi:superfamily II DNA/RNA helicase